MDRSLAALVDAIHDILFRLVIEGQHAVACLRRAEASPLADGIAALAPAPLWKLRADSTSKRVLPPRSTYTGELWAKSGQFSSFFVGVSMRTANQLGSSMRTLRTSRAA